ncbi:exocyst complex component 1-like isoform X2 [Ostrea edulis]|uniref:exocyst complex component 1-like isoform X2 n=1 Tax=Ostrea edulis TaxID=37623 RepID=UPI0020945EF5|nr:exocyst complex component 1-like isoform X2 [Ostrea edulis]XP_056011628.1 exocyst complex component 1-like isoform X2 [Ostrea edulis]
MTAIKHTLNRDVFLPNDERLIGFVHVTKVGRKKKTSFLCAALSTETPVQARVYQVKKADKTEAYKKKVTWLLRELKVVDGKSSSKETAEFDLHFEKVYKWVASSVNDKETFISCLWKLSQRYLIQKPDFLNVPRHLLEEVSRPTGSIQTTQQEDDIVTMEDDYQALTPKEESDLDQLMSECKIAISNAELFAEQLSKQLSVLDGANIHSIMGSEDQVLNLMRLLDDGIQSAEKIEDKLEFYDSILQNVKDQMEVMKEKDALIQTRNRNHQLLLEKLDNLVIQLDLDTLHLKALQDSDLSTPGGIYECTAAAHALQKCLNADIHPALNQMTAVEEQQRKFTKFSDKFGKRLAHHLNNLFIQQGNELGETLSRQAPDFRLPQHHSAHRDLTPYADLMLWLKNSDFHSFTELSKVYTQNLSKLYNKEIQDFLEMAKQKLGSKPDKNKLSVGLTSQARALSGSSSSLNRKMSGSVQSLNSDSISMHGSSHDLAMRHLFDQVIDKILNELEPVCLAEQDFCVRFFHLAGDTPVIKEPKQEEESDDIWKPIQTAAAPLERHMNEEVRRMMGDLFPNLESELEAFVSYADRLDGFNSMYMLVRMSQHVNKSQDTGSFLSVMFASCLVKIKRNFDKFISNQIKAIQDFKVSKKSRCGIIAFVHNFEDFANQAESIFKLSDRHTHLDKSYKTLVVVIYEQIARVANESQKTPKDVVMMENFHHMYSTLSSLKIPCLESDRKEAKQIYQDNLTSYTLNLLGRPLEKLHVFFEGVQNRVATGVKPEEVGFQLAFSKQELRKVIKEYPVKEVKKGLDGIYKKTHKDLCEEENLLQVVWFSMQDEFIKQIKHYEDLINQCYPDSGITLEFKVEEVLSFFSEIAQNH